jgi:hypothetical protein
MSSQTQTLGSWVRIPLEECMSVRVSSVFVLPYTGSDLETELITRSTGPTYCLQDP